MAVPSSMVIGSFAKPLMPWVVPSTVALAPLKLMVPKFASGRTFLPTDGASITHSADCRAAPLALFVVLNVALVLTFLSVRAKDVPLVYWTSALIRSPAFTAKPETVTLPAG